MANAFVMVRFKGTRRLPERSAEPPREDLAFVRLSLASRGPVLPPCHDLLVLARAIAIGVEASLGR
jgi:hypothetical protein